jgi:hypothetical protein
VAPPPPEPGDPIADIVNGVAQLLHGDHEADPAPTHPDDPPH